MADGDGHDELVLEDIVAYLDAHEPLAALWGADDAALLDGMSVFEAPLDSLSAETEAATGTDAPANSSPTSSALHEQQPQHKPRGDRNVTRERRKREITELRAQCGELEQRLVALQQQKREPRAMQRSLLLATWKGIAQRQLVLRMQAESENWRLRQRAQQHLAIAGSMQQSLNQWITMEPASNSTTPDTTSRVPRPSHIAMNPSSSVDPGDVEIYRQLLAEVDGEHERMDRVMRENGLVHWQVATKTSTMHMKTRPASRHTAGVASEPSLYIELMEADVIPFEMPMVFNVSWQCWQRRQIPRSSIVYQHIPLHDGGSKPTIVSKMRFEVVVSGESVLMDLLCVVRAYIERDRISWVLRGITKADSHFPGVYIDETDWQILTPISRDGKSAATAIFACAHMESKQFGSGEGRLGGDHKALQVNASPLANLVASAYEVDMDEVSNMMMNMLLQDSSAAVGSANTSAAYVRQL